MGASSASPSPPPFPQIQVFSCTACERILSDTTALLTRTPTTLAFTTLTSFHLLPPTTSPAGSADEYCTYAPITCARCTAPLGRHYLATTPNLSAVAGRYVLDAAAVALYTVGSEEPTVSAAPLDDGFGTELETRVREVMGFCVYLAEGQTELARAVWRAVGAAEAGERVLEIARGDDGREGEDGGFAERVNEKVLTLEDRLTAIEEKLAAVVGSLGELRKRKRGSSASRNERSPSPVRAPASPPIRRRRMVVPNSQSPAGAPLLTQESDRAESADEAVVVVEKRRSSARRSGGADIVVEVPELKSTRLRRRRSGVGK